MTGRREVVLINWIKRDYFSHIRIAKHWIKLFREAEQCPLLEVFKTLGKALCNQVWSHSWYWVLFQSETSCNSIWKRFSFSYCLLQVTNSECDRFRHMLFSVKNAVDKVRGDRNLIWLFNASHYAENYYHYKNYLPIPKTKPFVYVHIFLS